MATVRDYVRAHLPGTYEKLTTVADGDQSPDSVGLAITNAMETLLVPDTDESDLSEFARRYVAAVAVLLVIPAAIDFYMTKTRLSDGASRPPGVTPLGGETSRNYDRIQGLKDIEARLQRWVLDQEARFVEEVGEDAVYVSPLVGAGGIAVSGSGEMLTTDPTLFPRPDSPGFVRTRFGVLVQAVNRG